MPSLRDLSDAVDSYHSRKAKAIKARKDWEGELKRRKDQQALEELEKNKKLLDVEIAGRNSEINSFKSSDEFKSIASVVGEEDLIK